MTTNFKELGDAVAPRETRAHQTLFDVLEYLVWAAEVTGSAPMTEPLSVDQVCLDIIREEQWIVDAIEKNYNCRWADDEYLKARGEIDDLATFHYEPADVVVVKVPVAKTARDSQPSERGVK